MLVIAESWEVTFQDYLIFGTSLFWTLSASFWSARIFTKSAPRLIQSTIRNICPSVCVSVFVCVPSQSTHFWLWTSILLIIIWKKCVFCKFCLFWYWYYYLHWSRDSLSPICWIFFLSWFKLYLLIIGLLLEWLENKYDVSGQLLTQFGLFHFAELISFLMFISVHWVKG